MNTALAILIFVGIIVGYIFLRIGMQKGVNAAVNNTVLRGTNEKGKRMTQQTLRFNANAPVDAVRKAVLASVKVEPDQPKAIPGVYLAGASDRQLVYDLGCKLQTSFRAVLTLTPTATGTHGTWEITNWLKVNGLVTGVDVMERVVAQINTGLRSVDPNARLQ